MTWLCRTDPAQSPVCPIVTPVALRKTGAAIFQCEAFADACADSSSVGLGGYVKFPSGLKRFFQLTISKAALASLCPFFPGDGNPQHLIAAWELLSQCALVWTTHAMLPLAHPNLHMVLRCDNAASEAAAWKGLSLAKGLCAVLRQFCDLQRRTCISAHIEHVPGFLNDVADSLSRDGDPLDLGFCDEDRICPPPGGNFLSLSSLKSLL